jgi:hypothetical protein
MRGSHYNCGLLFSKTRHLIINSDDLLNHLISIMISELLNDLYKRLIIFSYIYLLI